MRTVQAAGTSAGERRSERRGAVSPGEGELRPRARCGRGTGSPGAAHCVRCVQGEGDGQVQYSRLVVVYIYIYKYIDLVL